MQLDRAIKNRIADLLLPWIGETLGSLRAIAQTPITGEFQSLGGKELYDAMQAELSTAANQWALKASRQFTDGVALALVELSEEMIDAPGRPSGSGDAGDRTPEEANPSQSSFAPPATNITPEPTRSPLPVQLQETRQEKRIGKLLRGGLEGPKTRPQGNVVRSFRDLERAARQAGYAQVKSGKEQVMVNRDTGARLILPRPHGGSGSGQLGRGMATKLIKQIEDQTHAAVESDHGHIAIGNGRNKARSG